MLSRASRCEIESPWNTLTVDSWPACDWSSAAWSISIFGPSAPLLSGWSRRTTYAVIDLGDTRDRHGLLVAGRAERADSLHVQRGLPAGRPRDLGLAALEGETVLRREVEFRRGQFAHRLHDAEDDHQQDDQRGPDLDPAHRRPQRGLGGRRGVRQLRQQVQRRLRRQRLLRRPLGPDLRYGGGGPGTGRLRRPGGLGRGLARRGVVRVPERDELAGPLGVGLGDPRGGITALAALVFLVFLAGLGRVGGVAQLQHGRRLVDGGRGGRGALKTAVG